MPVLVFLSVGIKSATMKLQLLQPLPDVVERWGGLWSYSCFWYESLNGVIKNFVHGTRFVCSQVQHCLWHFYLLQVTPNTSAYWLLKSYQLRQSGWWGLGLHWHRVGQGCMESWGWKFKSIRYPDSNKITILPYMGDNHLLNKHY